MVSFKILAAVPLFKLAACYPGISALPNVAIIPNEYTNGSVDAEFVSKEHGLDGQKLSGAPNNTAYDWWYFDGRSSSTNASVQMIFFETGPNGFPNTQDKPLSIRLDATFDNGTVASFWLPASDSAVIKHGEHGVFGHWPGAGGKFWGSGLGKAKPVYKVEINSPSYGVFGTLTLTSRAPAHYACSANEAGVTELVMPNVGWSNAQPDADVEADFSLGGSNLSFQGIGYHDKNWGLVPFPSALQSWYWGHGRFGPYSVVWFDTRAPDGSSYVSGYVAKDGEILSASCAANAATVRPFGENDEYPPTPDTGVPTGFAMEFDLGEGGKLWANVTNQFTIMNSDTYQRCLGALEGGLVGGEETFEGKSVHEVFKFAM